MKKIIKALLLFICLLIISSCTKNVSIRLDYNNGDSNSIIEVTIGEEITLPSVTRDGAIFVGWKDVDGNIYKNTFIAKEDTVLIAEWNYEEYNKAKKIESDINNLSDIITLSNEEELNSLNDKYNNLSMDAKTLVTNYKKLEYSIKALDILKEYGNIEDINDDSLIESKNIIYAYYNLYINYKDYASKQFDINTIINIYNDLNELTSIINMIDNIGTDITSSDIDYINNVKAYYEELDSKYQEQVTNYEKLVAALEKVKNLSVDKEELLKDINNSILTLPTVITYDAKTKVDELTYKINILDSSYKSRIEHFDIYENAINKIKQIEEDTDTITYCLGLDVYNSKYDLMNAYFSDFYSFILYHYGKEVLEEKSVYSASDFVNMAMDYYGGRDHCYNLGDNFKAYYLQRSDNNIVENQPTDKFIGYCYQNNRYRDLIMFLIPFFNYWRLDEHCATINTNWADFFNDSWSSCVDTCKYFYYDENTSYVKTARMIDCLTYCSNVVYGNLETNLNGTVNLNYNLKLRGYTFLGWYDNPNFEGEAITSVSNTGTKVILYAKWGINQEQVDKDTADFAEVMIYNLTTTTANVDATTVGYARAYYDSLSDNAKKQVLNYDKLVAIEASYKNKLDNEIVLTIITNIENKTFEELSIEFLNDYNTFNKSNYTYDDFINSPLSIHNKTKLFFEDNEMYMKWSWLATYFLSIDIFQGVKIQANRIISHEGKDQEYFTKAIGCFFTKTNASNIQFINYDFSNATCPNQNVFSLRYTYAVELLELKLSGYTFMGYYSDREYKNKVEEVSNDMPTTLYAYFIKNEN